MRNNQSRLEELLDNANKKIQKLQNEKQETEKELKELQAKVFYDDTEESSEAITASGNDYDHMSICEVAPVDYKGRHSIVRLADIDKKGNIEIFNVDDDLPKTFENRNKLFYKQGPTEEGIIGVWNWSATPNSSDPSRDYVTSSYIPVVNPIEVIFIQDCKSVDELLEKMKKGIDKDISMPRTLFVAYLTKDQYIGVLCRSRDLEQNGSQIKIESSVVQLPVYDISARDIVRLQNNKSFYRSIRIGIPDEVVSVKDRLDIVRSIIMSRNSWSMFKKTGRSRNEWKHIREFMEGMDTKSVTEEIAKVAHCSSVDAQKMLDDFIMQAGDYIDGTSIEDNIIAAVVYSNSDLMKRCKNLIKEDWIKENQAAVDDANKTLSELQEQIEKSKRELEKEISEGRELIINQKKEATESLEKIKIEYAMLQKSSQILKDKIAVKEKLVSDIDIAVRKKIRQAQHDAAEFIATFAFSNPSALDKIGIYPEAEKSNYIIGSDLKKDNLEENSSWDVSIDTISYELIAAGVKNDYALPLAAYMYAAYLSHSALLMIGPNGGAIVDAFSAGLFGRTAGVLECTEKFSSKSVEVCNFGEDSVIKIINPFSGEWVARIPEVVGGNKFYIAVYPYSEDIQIEPKSLYNYMLPVFTEVLIEREPKGELLGGKKSENYKEFPLVEVSRCHNKLLTEMHASLLVRTRIQTLLNNMHAMLNDQNIDYDVLFALLPYAFATMQMPLLLGVIEDLDSNKLAISKNIRELIKGMYGED